MLISKTKFINYIRCNRYAALDEIQRDKKSAIVSFTDEPELEDLIGEENKSKIKVLLEGMFDEEEKSLLLTSDLQTKTMLPYYNQIEIVSGEVIKKRYGGLVTYSLDTRQQKRFKYGIEGFHFYCFLDGFQQDDKNIRIFEVKATTSKKFLDMKFKDDDKKRKPIFTYSPKGILVMQEDLYEGMNEDYYKKREKLKNRLSNIGRYIYDIAYQRYVFQNSNETKKKVSYYLAVLNSEYVHQGKTSKDGEPVYDGNLITLIDVTSLTKDMMTIIEKDVEIVKQRLNMLNANAVHLGKHCQRNDSRQCQFYNICYKKIPEKNSIFTYMGSHHGFKENKKIKHERDDLINEGYYSAFDIPVSWLNRENNVIQRRVMDSDVTFRDIKKIREGIKCLKYPIYHLDFESFPCPLPRFKGEKPYSQSLFQYSIHIEKTPGNCDIDKDNFSYISTKHEDLRLELLEKMIEVIKKDNGTILVYNKTFEQTRLKELAEIYPQHDAVLLDMIDRLFDLMHLLKGNKKLYKSLGFEEELAGLINYYHNDLNGSYSIKKVLPIFSDLSYDEMGIANGTDALVTYARFPIMGEKEFKKKYDDLIKYCKQDTWAMVEILNKLREI